MNKELPNVYVYKPTREEAIEIVERIEENGGETYDCVSGTGLKCFLHLPYNLFEHWGSVDNKSATGDVKSFEHGNATQVTMDEFRELFPRESEKLQGTIKEFTEASFNVYQKMFTARKSKEWFEWDNKIKQQDATLEALKELTAAYRRLGGLDCAYDKELLVAEAIIKKVGE